MSQRVPLRILAIGAHPDDIELGCAGTLARCIERGDSVTMAVVCKGDSASSDLAPEQLVAVRSQELKDSAAVLGADLIEMGHPDYGVWMSRETVVEFAGVIRQARPDVVITHYWDDYGGDHNNTFEAVRDATIAASVPNVTTGHPAISRIPLLFVMEPLGGYNFQPEIYVDISKTLPIKKRMLECHRSQLEWMSRYGGMDCGRYIETVARFRGYQAGVELAEGFIAHKSWAHIPAGPVLP